MINASLKKIMLNVSKQIASYKNNYFQSNIIKKHKLNYYNNEINFSSESFLKTIFFKIIITWFKI